ncbi:tetratricopeptide repeat protein 21B-like isoform X2 [Neocloeon triangulifer]|uniref:tetratricopeptide repeat protein 21B-like isoform X2 n=1 Tax=Neocloeon triangulifer TaxID=2078957 RepID=UPI00286F6B3A|nr:tetratricopeptide repeat protein 21B-like isoform X2 [Neocloeon triangulifer]
MDVRLCKTLSVQYGVKGLYQSMYEMAKRGRTEHPAKEAEFRLLICCALRLLGRTDEAKKESEIIVDPEQVDAFKYFCRETSTLDGNSEHFALVLLLMGKHRQCADLRVSRPSVSALCCQGWSLLALGSPQEAHQAFEKALKLSPNDLEANLGVAQVLKAKDELDKCLDVLDRLVVKYPDVMAPIEQKMLLHLSLCDWEQASEQATRVRTESLDAVKLGLLRALCLDGNFEHAEAEMAALNTLLRQKENFNPWAYFQCGKLVSRVCSKNAAILREAQLLVEKAIELQPANCEFRCELGLVLQLQDKTKEALKELKAAVKLDSSSVFALSNLTLCQVLENRQSDTVRQQVELLKELQGQDPSAQLLFMASLLDDRDRHLPLKALQAHLRTVEGLPFGPDYLTAYNPEFVFSIIGLLLNRMHVKKDSPELLYLLKILKPITQTCPGLWEAKLLHAKALHLSGDSSGALSQLRRFNQSSEAQVLVATILLAQNDLAGANSSLESALSFDFGVKEHPVYLLVQAKSQRAKGNAADAAKWLKTALASSTLTAADKVTLSLELAETLTELGRPDEASDLLRKTIAESAGTTEQARLVTAQADLALRAGRVDHALEILNSIGPSELHFLEARHKMAEIYLVHKKDRKKFAACYLSVVEQKPGVESQILLGDAYMRVHEPEKAVEVYEQILKSTSKKDVSLVRKIGQALVKTHMYGKAVNFYADQAKKHPSLRKDLVELLIRMKNFDRAEAILKSACAGSVASNDSEELMARCQLLLLLARVQEQTGHAPSALSTLTEAKDMQNKVLKRLQIEGTGKLAAQKVVAANICRLMAKQGSNQEAIKYYKEALVHQPGDPETLIALAKLYLQVDDLALCQATCGQLLRSDPENEAACVMMADISFRKTDFETASVHFQQLLNKQPRYWTALARFIEVMRRAGTLALVLPYLEKAALKGDEPGLAYCQGLYSWYSGEPTQALKHFNRARRDPEWGRQAICSMIQICLNNENSAEVDSKDSRETALKTAEKLLGELNPRPVTEEKNTYQLLVCFLLLAKRDKALAEQALQELTLLAGVENSRVSIGVTLAISMAYLVLKQSTRARNQLKRVSKHPWTFEEAEYLERNWLLLADLYIQSGKYDSASELLNKVLVHNKSCTKAFEGLGLIHEKEQQYKDAASKYEQAWTFGNQSNPAVGYKMAYNLLKSKKYVATIDVCHQVLSQFPNYPNIQKDILEKARSHLRT